MNTKYLAFYLTIAFAGCAAYPSNGSEMTAGAAPALSGQRRDDALVPTNQIAGAATQACPSNNFDKFFRAFCGQRVCAATIEHERLDAAAMGTEHEHEYGLKWIATFERTHSTLGTAE